MPNTIADNLQRLVNAKGAIATAITNRGGTVGSSDGLEDFASDIAAIPNTYAAGDEGKVVSSGALVVQSSSSTSSNGTVDTTLINSLAISVPTYSAADNGKVVQNGELVTQSTHKPITANEMGIDTTYYSSVDVTVPNTYSASDEGKVVSNGALVAQTSDTVTENDTYDTTLINSLTVNVPSSGGGGGPESDVNFRDYDGTIVASYSATEFAALTALPKSPTHDGLTAQGWNWSLADAKAYVAANGKLEIGQMYITSDGKTRLYITLPEGRTTPWLKLYLNANSEIDIDWGDGSAHSTFTSTGVEYKNEQHVYASAGDYVIAITVVSGSFSFWSSSSSLSTVLTNNDGASSSPDRAYLNSIKRIEIGSDVTRIGNYAFSGCYSLSSITIPDSVTTIGNAAFQNCYTISSITIPDSVTTIGSNAFYICSSLSSITIPDSVTSIATYTFYNCYSLSSITIPDSVTSIGDYAFQNCYTLLSITIPDSVTSIGDYAFSGCYSLLSITIPDGVTSIKSYAFQNCQSLSSITIPDSVTTIGYSGFIYCYSLSSITIPDSVTSIGSDAFRNCCSLSSITINKTEGSISGSPWGATTGSPTYTQIVWTG